MPETPITPGQAERDARAREARILDIRREAEQKGRVEHKGIRPAGAPFPLASPSTGYYKVPLLKEPQWTELIPLYFFLGGASGSLGVIGSVADLISDDNRKLAEHARWLALGTAAVSSVLLVCDLGRPARFLHMLRVFKPQSTMSMGSWVLSGFSISAGASSFADLLRSKFGETGPITMMSAAGRIGSTLFGMPFHNYTGVLLGTTVIPVWNSRVKSLPHHFGMSGLQSGACLLELAGHTDSTALNTIGLLSAALESKESIDTFRSSDRALAPTRRGLSGALIQAGAVLSGPVPIALRMAAMFAGNKRGLRKLAAWSGIVGSLCVRYGWVHAGKQSSRDWRLPMQIDAPGSGPADAYGSARAVASS